MEAQHFTGPFAGAINFMSYEFEDGGSYKKFFYNFRTHSKFRQGVLNKGMQLALARGNNLLYEDTGVGSTCLLVNEYLHDRYRFEKIRQPNVEMIFFSDDDLQLLKKNNKVQMLLPFYKLSFYEDKLDRYLLLEDEYSCLFLADGMKLFSVHALDFPEFNRFSYILRENENNPCVITVKKSPYLYDAMSPIPPIPEEDTHFY